MKYLSDTMSAEEAKKQYRLLAKTMHPDVGGDEEEFKILADEYSRIMHRSAAEQLPDPDKLLSDAAAMVNVIVETLRELYPRTPVILHYSYFNIIVEFKANTPIHRIVEIENVVRSFNYPFRVECEFHRPGRKSAIHAVTLDGITWINIDPEAGVTLPTTPRGGGRRYKFYKDPNSAIEKCVDTKLQHTYVARCGGATNMFKLLGLRA